MTIFSLNEESFLHFQALIREILNLLSCVLQIDFNCFIVNVLEVTTFLMMQVGSFFAISSPHELLSFELAVFVTELLS